MGAIVGKENRKKSQQVSEKQAHKVGDRAIYRGQEVSKRFCKPNVNTMAASLHSHYKIEFS